MSAAGNEIAALFCTLLILFTFVLTNGAEVEALGLSVRLCVFIMPPPDFGRLQTLLCRQPEPGEEGPISWELGLKQAAKKERKRQGKHI